MNPDASARVVAGIDAGGTRTRLLIVDLEGHPVARGETGCCSFMERGMAGAREGYRELWRKAWQDAGLAPRPADALFIGSGSILAEGDRDTNRLLAVESGMVPHREAVEAGNDAEIALAGGLLGRPGILLIAGTGSAAFGRNAEGWTWRAGGWGHHLDDRGSAHALGMGALIAATRDADGRDAATSLTPRVMSLLGIREIREIFRRVHHEGLTRAEIASLARDVVAEWQQGDVAARRLVEAGVAGLSEMVITVARRLGLASPELALTGGLIEGSTAYRESFLAHLRGTLPGVTVASEGLPPVVGAILLARTRLAGAAPREAWIPNLRRHIPLFP
jgi:N-acetylglucosamine kinase-like BadF-type ATPase